MFHTDQEKVINRRKRVVVLQNINLFLDFLVHHYYIRDISEKIINAKLKSQNDNYFGINFISLHDNYNGTEGVTFNIIFFCVYINHHEI